ncbi:MAG: hypothetical protein VYA86_05955 [Candidatus Thermoplasmatota archaeon]|nr:hypothetical protein [Candidatus Thermoplasmatota archaeon]
MQQQDGPIGVQSEQRGYELLTTFRLAGVGGGVKGLLNEKSLLLERRDGKGIRVNINAIRRVRHHHIPVIAPGLTWIGFITLILAARVLSGPIQIYALATGAITIFTWLMGRRPTLCIDTKHGDRHLLHGPDSLLLRTQMMINRLCDGKTLEEAREGLEDIQRNSNFPALSPLMPEPAKLNHVDQEPVKEAQLLPEVRTFDESDLESALKAMYHGDAGTLPEPKPASDISAVETKPATESFSSDSHADHAGKSLLERARNSLHETRAESTDWSNQQNLDNWSKPWEQKPVRNVEEKKPSDSAYERAWGRNTPGWYNEKQSPQSENRFETALVEAKEEGGTFFSGDMFDDGGSQTTDTGIFGNMFDTPVSTENSEPQFVQEPLPAPTWSGQAIRDANQTSSNALATTLPEPSPHALREECTLGVVAAARISEPLPKPEEKEQIKGVEEFPAIGALLRNTKKSRQRIAPQPKRGILSRIANRGKRVLARDGAKSITNSQRPVKIEGDDYADVYGDDDGFDNGEYREVSMRSGQILRLRADQDHQAEVAERLKSLSKSSGGGFADDETDALIQRLSDSGDLAPIANLLKAAETKQLSFGKLASTTPPKESPGHHGISRMG